METNVYGELIISERRRSLLSRRRIHRDHCHSLSLSLRCIITFRSFSAKVRLCPNWKATWSQTTREETLVDDGNCNGSGSTKETGQRDLWRNNSPPPPPQPPSPQPAATAMCTAARDAYSRSILDPCVCPAFANRSEFRPMLKLHGYVLFQHAITITTTSTTMTSPSSITYFHH